MTQPKLSDFPRFRQAIDLHLPGTVAMQDYLKRTSERLRQYGFEDANTLGMVCVCRDEIATPFAEAVARYWGRTFSCRSLGSFALLGRSGIATGLSHAPRVDGRRRFVFYALPHIAVSEQGEVGIVQREGIEQASHACGSLGAVVRELESGHIDVRTDFDDIEQCCVRQKILSALRYGDKPDLLAVTRLASTIIRGDLVRLAQGLDLTGFDYAYLTGILVHGPADTHWVYPEAYGVIGAAVPGGNVIFTGL